MNEKNYLTQVPPKSFFEHCAFLCVDLQGGPHVDEHARNYVKEMPAQWREMGFSLADVNAAVDYYVDSLHSQCNHCHKSLPRLWPADDFHPLG